MGNVKKIIEQFDALNIDGLMITGDWNRRYISGFTGSNGVILITKTETRLITDYRYIEQAKNQTQFDVVLHAGHTGHKDRIFDEVAKQVKEMKIARLGFEQQHLSFGFYNMFRNLLDSDLVPTYDLVEDLRMVKSKDEIEKLKVAAEITDHAYMHILNFIRPGLTELSVSDELQRFIKENGGTTTTFDPIVASGLRSSLPHGRASEKIIEEGDMVTIDFGANYKGYWADISRTVALGEPSKKMKEIQKVVLTSFRHCAANLKAGLTDQEVDKLMRNHLIESGYNEVSGTGTGHGIGLEVHEKPLFSVQVEKELKAGMTITIEPGIYLPDIGGARVEDVFLITEEGGEVLTPSTKELIII